MTNLPSEDLGVHVDTGKELRPSTFCDILVPKVEPEKKLRQCENFTRDFNGFKQ